MSTKPLEMPLNLTIGAILLAGSFKVTLSNLDHFLLKPKQQQQQPSIPPKVQIQLLSDPLKNLTITTNFDQHMPQVRDTFQSIIQSAAENGIKELMANPIEIDLAPFLPKTN